MKILIIDDHGVVREGVRRLLATHFGAEIFEANDMVTGLAEFEAQRPDVIILDLNFEGAGGLEILRRMKAVDANPKVIIFSMHDEPAYAMRALKSGAAGYVCKSAPVDELVAAVERVSTGAQYIGKDLAARIALSHVSGEDPIQSLSIREMEILRLLGDGKSMTDISEKLGIAYKTVANISSQMKTKLGVGRTADLIRLAIGMPKT